MHPVILKAARALVGDRLQEEAPASIAVEHGKIRTGGNLADAEVIDLGELTLLPGFIDTHVHIWFADPGTVLRRGVTTVRDLGWPPADIHPLARRSGAPDFDGPAILAAGQMLTVPGGYPTRAAWAPSGTGRELASPSEAEPAVEEQAAAGAVTIKVALNAAVGPTLDAETLRAVCDAAHARRLRVTAHIFGLHELEKAVDCGVDEMAHILLSPETIPESLIARMVAADMTVVPTLSITRLRTKRIAMQNLAAFFEAGGRVVYGTDLGNSGPRPGIDRREIGRMMRSGMDSRSIVAAGTTAAASWLGLDTKGRIAPGMDADIIGVRGDPLDASVSLTEVGFVMRSGRVVVRPDGN